MGWVRVNEAVWREGWVVILVLKMTQVWLEGFSDTFSGSFQRVSWWPLSSPDINKAAKLPAAWAGHVTKDASCDFKAICNFWKRSIQESPVTRWLKRLAERWAWRGVVVWSWWCSKVSFGWLVYAYRKQKRHYLFHWITNCSTMDKLEMCSSSPK